VFWSVLVAVVLLFCSPPSPYVFSAAGIVGVASVWLWLGLRVACDGGKCSTRIVSSRCDPWIEG
jgi:hypothetical protein